MNIENCTGVGWGIQIILCGAMNARTEKMNLMGCHAASKFAGSTQLVKTWEAVKMYYVIVRLFSLWYIAAFENGVMQYSIYGGYKREQDAKRQAAIHKINIEEIRR